MNEEKSIEEWCKDFLNVISEKYIINENGTVDVNSSVNISENLNLINKIPIQFGHIINGYFMCDNNHLTSLKGCPSKVDGFFSYSYNNLISLEFGPTEEIGDFYCCDNNGIIVNKLEFLPKKISGKGDFNCRWNPIYEEYSKYNNYEHYIRYLKLNKLCIY